MCVRAGSDYRQWAITPAHYRAALQHLRRLNGGGRGGPLFVVADVPAAWRAWGVEAKAVYIYLRDEYPDIHRVLTKEIAVLEKKKIIEPGYVHLRRGAGTYICGEESAMIESLEGKRGIPRRDRRRREPERPARGLRGPPGPGR